MISKETEVIMTSPSSPSSTTTAPAAGSQQGAGVKGRRYRQRPLGPAPFASFEDLSDELDSPPETARVPLPGIKEDPASQIQTPSTPHTMMVMGISLTEKEDLGLKEALSGSLDTPAPPRIDISRASSSSQHEDSITSSPDRDGGNQTLGYKEDGTVDLRSSTEELDYIQEPGTVEESEAKRKREKMMKKQQQLKQDFCETQSEIDFKERKDSSCSVMSEVGLLCISGRTSRLSSIGSAASGGSVASGVSHLSAGSQVSGRSTRSPSPHKMLLETSFCGSKPMQTQNIEAEAAPALVSHMEKQASRPSSRPPSRLCSRSPSPHKMLLETSFCGTKQIIPRAASEVKSEVNTEKVIQKAMKVTALEAKPNVEEPQPRVNNAKPKPTAETVKDSVLNTDSKREEMKNLDKKEILMKATKAKPINIPKIPDRRTNYSRPKKIISIRDIPADEIYIPLKGPEVDLEEIIRKASPNVKRKAEKQKAVDKSSDDVIFIPLHSPTESEKEKEREKDKIRERETGNLGTITLKQNFDDGIYIPLHSPPKSPKAPSSKTSILSFSAKDKGDKVFDSPAKKMQIGERSIPKTKREEPKKTKYEVFEDGSIFIPLHSPDEESKPIRTFEEEIRKVDEQLQKARELAEKRLQEEERQTKPFNLAFSEYGGKKEILPTGRPETTSGESRTPSPGSSLSRKSSFASLFRKSDITGSPDSSAGSLVRKKSGNCSNTFKDTGEGLRDRSRSHSKNRERQSPSAVTRSPSIKKNVFMNIFGKKKNEEKGKADDKTTTHLDQQFSYGIETGKGRFSSTDEENYYNDVFSWNIPMTRPCTEVFEEQILPTGRRRKKESKRKIIKGDYIIIPLRDPSVPSPGLEDKIITEDNQKSEEKPPSPVVVLERSDSQRSLNQSKGYAEQCEEVKRIENRASVTVRSDEERERFQENKISMNERRSSVESKKSVVIEEIVSEDQNEKTSMKEDLIHQRKLSEERGQERIKRKPSENILSPSCEDLKAEKRTTEGITDNAETERTKEDLERDSSLEVEEDLVKEEMMAVSTGGIRKLKLPPEPGDLGDDHERKGLVLQESFEDELPYVPTTLPLERSVGVPIIPVKHRVAEIKTCPIERPRSTTPINPSTLEEYINVREPVRVSAEEKMKISLPRDDSISGKSKSPRRFSAKGKSWFEFAEAVTQSPREMRKSSLTTTPSSPPPLPPRSSSPTGIVGLSTSAPQATSSWINFEELPEKRKQPKRITTVPPIRSSADGTVAPEKPSASSGGTVVYSYVSPEDCQCECHDHNSHGGSHAKESKRNRGIKERSKGELDLNCELPKNSHLSNKLIETQGDFDKSVKNECQDCESGRHEDGDEDIEKKPLLEYNSDCEIDESLTIKDGEWELVVPGRKDAERQSLLSDSSYEYSNHEVGIAVGFYTGADRVGMRPFEMDFDVKSNRSSIASQEDQGSPEEIDISLPQ